MIDMVDEEALCLLASAVDVEQIEGEKMFAYTPEGGGNYISISRGAEDSAVYRIYLNLENADIFELLGGPSAHFHEYDKLVYRKRS